MPTTDVHHRSRHVAGPASLGCRRQGWGAGFGILPWKPAPAAKPGLALCCLAVPRTLPPAEPVASQRCRLLLPAAHCQPRQGKRSAARRRFILAYCRRRGDRRNCCRGISAHAFGRCGSFDAADGAKLLAGRPLSVAASYSQAGPSLGSPQGITVAMRCIKAKRPRRHPKRRCLPPKRDAAQPSRGIVARQVRQPLRQLAGHRRLLSSGAGWRQGRLNACRYMRGWTGRLDGLADRISRLAAQAAGPGGTSQYRLAQMRQPWRPAWG